MPLYDFECSKCGHQYEALLKMDESHEALQCPKCKAKKPRKLFKSLRTNSWSKFLDTMDKKSNPNKFK
jgi:putative FmdB family regulatory protein